MSKVIEIKAMSQEEAITRALKIAEALPHHVVRCTTLQKSKSFLGLFNRQGVYEIEIDTNKKMPKAVKKEIKKEVPKKQIKKEVKKEIKQENKKIVKKESKPVQEKKKVVTKKQETKKSEPKKEIKKEVATEVKKENKDLTNEIKAKANELLTLMGLNLEIDVKRLNGRNYLVNLSGKDNGIIIGKKGKTLNSFEYLLNSMIKVCRIEVDVEGFREKRIETLRELGKKMSEKAIRTNRTVRLNPMPPRERKIIHEVVNTYPELLTNSEGREPKRYIVIKKKR